MWIGVSEGRVMPFVTRRRRDALMLLLNGRYPCRGRIAELSVPAFENASLAKISVRGLVLSPPPRFVVKGTLAPLRYSPARVVSIVELRPLRTFGVDCVAEFM